MKYIITESQYKKTIDKFLTNQFDPHENKYPVNYPNSVYWVKNGEIIVEITKKYFWVKSTIFDVISNMFSLNDNETGLVISEWIKKHYDLDGIITVPFGKDKKFI